MSPEKGRSPDNKVVLAKLSREEFSRFQQYCDLNEETINASLRRMILLEIDNPKPKKIAGKSVFEYHRDKDNFAWKVALDEGIVFTIDSNLPANVIEELFESIGQAIEERNSGIRKRKSGSVAFPTKLFGKRK